MSDQPQDVLARLIVQYAESFEPVEIAVYDGAFQRVARGVKRLEANLPPGLYKVEVRAGNSRSDKLIHLVPPGQTIMMERLQLATPALVYDTTLTHEYQRDFLNTITAHGAQPQVIRGQGSEILVSVREWRKQAKAGLTPKGCMIGLTLHNANDEWDEPIDLHEASIAYDGRDNNKDAFDPCAACLVRLNPGVYRLRLSFKDSPPVEQTIVATPNWQTQVFMLLADYGPDERRADLAGASILMDNDNFMSDPQQLRLTDLARVALINNRRLLPEDLKQVLGSKFQNPMLGLLGAHILLLTKPDWTQSNRSTFDTVMSNLTHILGEQHPDVAALWLSDNPNRGVRFEHPPMLRKSCSLVVDASDERPQIIVPGSAAFFAAETMWPSSLWCIWETPERRRRRGSRPEPAFDNDNEAVIEQYLNRYGQNDISTIVKQSGLPRGNVETHINNINSRSR